MRLKQLALLFAICVVVYGAVFYGVEHFRNRNGPWEVTFTRQPDGLQLTINQPRLNIRNVRLRLPGDVAVGNPEETQRFATARPMPFDVPGGQCVFLDPLALPGTVVLQIGGHEIQLMPRVLTVDKKEIVWKSDTSISLIPKW